MAEDTPGLLLLSIPSPHPGCSTCSVARRRLIFSCLLCIAVFHQAFRYSPSTSFGFLLFFPSSQALLFSFQYCIHDWHMLLPLPAHKATGPGYLSDRFGAVFLVSYCISLHTSVTCTSGYQWVHLLLALRPCSPTSLCGGTEGTSTASLFLDCLWAAWNLYHLLRFWNISRVEIFFSVLWHLAMGFWDPILTPTVWLSFLSKMMSMYSGNASLLGHSKWLATKVGNIYSLKS